MIHRIWGNTIIRTILLCFVSAAILTFLSSQELFSPLFTEYPKEFTYNKFSAVSVGQKMLDVHTLLGLPFSDSSNQLACDSYSRPKSWGSFGITDYTGWISIKICYDTDGLVTDTVKNTFYN
jgi:hypothetical protein